MKFEDVWGRWRRRRPGQAEVAGILGMSERSGVALVLPCIGRAAMQAMLDELSAAVAPDAHAVVLMGRAAECEAVCWLVKGEHASDRLSSELSIDSVAVPGCTHHCAVIGRSAMGKPSRKAPEGVAGALLICVALASVVIAPAGAQDEDAGDFAHPTRHFRVPNPARLSEVEALSVYDRIRDGMVDAYRRVQDPLSQSLGDESAALLGEAPSATMPIA